MAQKKKKHSPWLVKVIVILLLLHLFSFLWDETPTDPSNSPNTGVTQANTNTSPSTEVPSSPPQTQPCFDRFPNLGPEYDSHILLDCRNRGSSNTLTGDVHLTMIMVNTPDSVWTVEAVEKYKAEQVTATQKLLNDAALYRVTLDLSIDYLYSTTTQTLSMENSFDFATSALYGAGLPEPNSVDDYLKQHHNADNVAVLFCVNYPGRSFAVQWNQSDYFEYAVLYSEHADYRHELNHLFGAKDYYYPESVKILAEGLFPNSIMLTSGDVTTDSLTAYLLGWTDIVYSDALSLLAGTMHITQEDISASYDQQVITGRATIRYLDGTYTGDLLDGIPHGYGYIIWDSGDSYEGNWISGAYYGTGIFVYASGDYYSGEWQNYQMHGYGTMVWTSGASYTGQWANSQFHGFGTYTFPDGTTRTGQWHEGNFVE